MSSSPRQLPRPAGPKHRAWAHLPEWNLDDLYPGPQSPELADDLERAAQGRGAFAGEWRGGLGPGRGA
jgi:oligoendopeptidase F